VGLSICWDGEASGLHAELQGYVDERTVVRDGLSTNGIFVNGHQVADRVHLRNGAWIGVGQTVLALVVRATAQPRNCPRRKWPKYTRRPVGRALALTQSVALALR
jgi:pSer/pThr/pTyr-binding forkhead associated (FHA) protein